MTTTAKHSFKSLMKEGTFKRVDGFRVLLKDLEVEAGFNLRTPGKELDEHIANLTAAYLAGEQMPPIEVRVDEATGRVLVVDGHCRRQAMNNAAAQGAPIEWVDVVPFRGNDLDRIARIITSQEGKKLSPLEVSMGYKRLTAYNLTAEAIAQRFHKTRQHVEQLLLLANANHDLHELVASGKVSAALAVEAIRKHGEKAGAVLGGEAEKAASVGKKKVTASTINGKALPKKVVTSLVDEVDAFMGELPKDARVKLGELETAEAAGRLPAGQQVSIPAGALLSLLRVHAEVNEARQAAAAKAAAKAAKASQNSLPAAE